MSVYEVMKHESWLDSKAQEKEGVILCQVNVVVLVKTFDSEMQFFCHFRN